MSNTASPYDDLFEAVLERSPVTIKTANPKSVRTGLQKARITHNNMASILDMPVETRRIVVAGVKDKPNQYTVAFHEGNTFEIVTEDTEPNDPETVPTLVGSIEGE